MNFRAVQPDHLRGEWCLGFGLASHLRFDARGRVTEMEVFGRDRQFAATARRIAETLGPRLMKSQGLKTIGAARSPARHQFCALLAHASTGAAIQEGFASAS